VDDSVWFQTELFSVAKTVLMAWNIDLTASILHQDQDSIYTSYAWADRGS